MSDPKYQRHDTARTASAPNAAAQPGTAPRQQPATPANPAAVEPNAPRPGSSGRVRHDERGNAVWDWVTTTTKNALLSATNMLKKLDSTELSLEEPADEKAAMLPKHRPGGGFNPYEQADKPPGKK
ncbi:MAG: hypothetical protein WAK94_00350 [Steroidobacteraceae bacterium]